MASAVSYFLGLGLTFGPGLSAPTGQHPGGEHHLGETAGQAGAPADAAGGGLPSGVAVADGASLNGSFPTPLASTTAREG
jgi:hypothetical protein